jgi:hypothetical protein
MEMNKDIDTKEFLEISQWLDDFNPNNFLSIPENYLIEEKIPVLQDSDQPIKKRKLDICSKNDIILNKTKKYIEKKITIKPENKSLKTKRKRGRPGLWFKCPKCISIFNKESELDIHKHNLNH